MELKIYTERLKDGEKDVFSGKVPPSFMPEEKDLFFKDDIEFSGEAYVAGDHLIIKLVANTKARIPCSICNTLTEIPLQLENFYHAEPIENAASGVFDFSDFVRSDLLLALPAFAECGGKCPERTVIKKYLKESDSSGSSTSTHFPFSGL